MLTGVERRLAMRRMVLIEKNLNGVINGIPRWGRRISDMDRDMLIQALADLEHFHAIINEETYEGRVMGATKKGSVK